MSFKLLPTVQTIDNIKHFNRADSIISSSITTNQDLVKSFSISNALQNYLVKFRPDSPLTKQALKILGIDKSEILTEESAKGKKTMNLLRSEQKSLRLLKALREIFKKRKELKEENNNANNNLKNIEETPKKIQAYFRKRFYSPQELGKSEEIESLCEIEKNFLKLKRKEQKIEEKNKKRVNLIEFLEKRQDSNQEKREQITKRLEKMRESNDSYWNNQKMKTENTIERKKALIIKMHDDFNTSLRILDESVRTKERNIENLRKKHEGNRIETIKIFHMNEKFKKERVDDFQREEAERIKEQGDFLLTNYEQKVRACEEKMRQNFKKNAKSLERKTVRNDNSNEKTSIKSDEPRKVRIMRKMGGTSRSLENNKRLEEIKEREIERIEELVERNDAKEMKIYENIKKNKEEMMIKFERMKIKREENWTNYQRNKRAKVSFFYEKFIERNK
jgi:hypothetical protein